MERRANRQPKPGQAVCAEPGCGAPLWWIGSGKRPQKCGEHAKNPSRYKPGTKLVPVPAKSPSRRAARREDLARGERAKAAAVGELNIVRMALGLGRVDDPVRAARMVGLGELSEEWLLELAQLARSEESRGVREGRPSEIASLYSMFLGLNAVHLLEEVAKMSPGSRAMASRLVQQVIDALGGSKMIYPTVIVNLGAPQVSLPQPGQPDLGPKGPEG